jgi:hypothetical protein
MPASVVVRAVELLAVVPAAGAVALAAGIAAAAGAGPGGKHWCTPAI